MIIFPESSPKTDAKYDIVKFFLSLLVLAIHSVLYPLILYPWLRIAVPIFFIMSSYFVFLRINEVPVEKHKVIIKKFVIRNLLLYLCWCVILLPITLYVRKDTWFAGGFFENTAKILQSLLFGSTFVASWFIIATIIGVIIVYMLSKIIKHNFILFFIFLSIFCIVTLTSSYSFVIDETIWEIAIDKYISVFGGIVCSFPAAVFWVFIGKLFAEQKIKIKSLTLLIFLIICSSILLFLEWKLVMSLDGSYNNDSYFMLAPLGVLLFAAIQKINPFFWKYSVLLKRASTIIYVTHGSILPIVGKLLVMFFHVRIPALSFIFTALCCITIYLLIEIIIMKVKNHCISKTLKLLY